MSGLHQKESERPSFDPHSDVENPRATQVDVDFDIEAAQQIQEPEGERKGSQAPPLKEKQSFSATDSTELASKHFLVALTDPTQKERIENNWFLSRLHSLAIWLSRFNIEAVGIAPILPEQRKGTQWWSPGLLWFSANVNVLTFSGGTLAPSLGLGMGSALVSIFLFSLLLSLPAAYFSTFGPRLGMRQMVQSRYSWGYFPACIACLLNAIGMIGFTILNSILGGQTLAAVPKNDRLSSTVGIVIIAVISLIVSFSGIKVLHYFERWLWAPVLVCFVVLIGIAGTGPNGLHVPADDPGPTARGILGMGAVVAGYLVSWSPLASDVTHYLQPDTNPHKIFWAVFFGLFLSTAPFMMLGAAFAISSTDNQAWSEALETSNGALFDLVLSGPGGAGNFGRFLTTLLALSAMGNIAATLYSFGLSLQTLLPFLNYIPRFIWPVFAIAITLPLAIVGADHFYTTLSNFTYLLGYWASLFVAVVLVEHVIIRRRDFTKYDSSAWANWRRLPPGIAALAAAILSLGLVIPSMDQAWFTGPIAERSGDLGFELGFVICALLYVPFRLLERKYFGR